MTRTSHNIGSDANIFATPAEEAWQRSANKHAARRELISLRRTENLAQRVETLSERRTDLTARSLASLRELMRAAYRKVTNIEIEERDVMRGLLEQMEKTGDYTVDELRQDVRRLLRNADGVPV